MRTKIYWNLHNHCTAQCTYCPSTYWGGEEPRHISEYLEITNKIISHYSSLGRNIDWEFNGGEPLDMFDFPMILKLCKENSGNIKLNSNGGKMWLDWWAIEPHIDVLNLTYHYWQKEPLIKFILDSFHNKSKIVNVTVPIRPNFFEEDINRAKKIENNYNLTVNKSVLYHGADKNAGFMYEYKSKQLAIMSGIEYIEYIPEKEHTSEKEHIPEKEKIVIPLVVEQNHFKETTLKERFEERILQSPSFTGMACNIGIETLNISHLGWTSGSTCNNLHLGNIWDKEFELPKTPSVCKMNNCLSPTDQLITKFSV